MITHVVLLGFTDKADRAEAAERLRALPSQIPAILSLKVGLDTAGQAGSSDLVLITEHADTDGLVSYVEHPVHQEFVAWAKPRLNARAAVDTDAF